MKGFKNSTKTIAGHHFTRSATPVKPHVRALPMRKAAASAPMAVNPGTDPSMDPDMDASQDAMQAPGGAPGGALSGSVAMAKGGRLSTASRKALPKSDFGLPAEGKYPMPDKSHAANAKARATQMVAAGKLSPSSKAKIDAKANKVLKKAQGGRVESGDADTKQDKAMIKAAVHKHERHDHPGKPLTQLRTGGRVTGAKPRSMMRNGGVPC